MFIWASPSLPSHQRSLLRPNWYRWFPANRWGKETLNPETYTMWIRLLIFRLGDRVTLHLSHVVNRFIVLNFNDFQTFVIILKVFSLKKRDVWPCFVLKLSSLQGTYSNTADDCVNDAPGIHRFHRCAINTRPLLKRVNEISVPPEVFRPRVASLEFHSHVICFHKEYSIIFLGT